MFLSLKIKVRGEGLLLLAAVAIVFMTTISVQPAMAQNVEFRTLMAANDLTCLVESGTKVFGGLNGGGLVVWDAADPTISEVWNSSSELSGNYITDLAVSGSNLWVATLDVGVTRIENADTNPQFRQYSGNLSSKRITAITAAVVSGKEIAYYAMEGEGVGGIADGLPGFVFTTLDGLLSDDSNSLQLFEGDLFVASDLGISLFRDNVFTTRNDGLASVVVNDLTLDADGSLLAGTNSGVFRWDPNTETWSILSGLSSAVVEISARPGEIWALASNGDVSMFDGLSWIFRMLQVSAIRTLSAGNDLWIGGRTHDPAMANSSFLVYLSRQNADLGFTVWNVDASLVRNAEGVALGINGDAWIGSWSANAISRFDGENYSHIFEIGDADNNYSGLFDHDGNFLCMTTHPNGDIWANQFGRGPLIINPDTGGIQQLHHNVTALRGGRLLNMRAHPDGTMILMHDVGDAAMVDILVTPADFENDNNWLALPEGLPGLGNGTNVYDALVERNDVIWFAVGDVGLVRWDINGDSLGPDDEITWLDTSDDRWFAPVSTLPFSSADPKAAKSLALAADGTIWLGGSGVARFSYNDNLGSVIRTEETWPEKTSPYMDGLVSGAVSGIALDRNNDLWVATSIGLNRLRSSGTETIIDVFMDVENYLSHPNYGILYSANALTELPSGMYKDMVASEDGSKILISSDRGAVVLTIDESSTGNIGTSLSDLYCYPNPFILAEADGGLRLGGLPASNSSELAEVEIYNIEGQMVYSSSSVTPETPFWSGLNRVGEPAVTGMYVVKVVWQNMTAICPLAVVR